MIRKWFADSADRRNLVVLATGSFFAFLFAAYLGLFGGIEEWERRYNLTGYHLGEFASLAIVLAFATAAYLFRRHREFRGEAPSTSDPWPEGKNPKAGKSTRYREMETLFRRVEVAKREWEKSLDAIQDMVILSDLDGAIHRCNRAFRDFVGLPYEEIVRQNILSLLTKFGIEREELDLKALNARIHISGKWFAVRSHPYTDFETAHITRVVIVIRRMSPRKVSEEKVQFVWGNTGNPRPDGRVVERVPPQKKIHGSPGK